MTKKLMTPEQKVKSLQIRNALALTAQIRTLKEQRTNICLNLAESDQDLADRLYTMCSSKEHKVLSGIPCVGILRLKKVERAINKAKAAH